jgi:signal peptidase I
MEDIKAPESEPTPEKETKSSHHLSDWVSTIAVIIMAPLLALFLTTFVFQTYEVDGPSMQNTLHNKDRLIVLKLHKSWAKITGHDYIPHRYDIIVFNHRGVDSTNDQKQLIKRVIGLPGDRVVLRDGIVTIYNKEHPSGYLVDQGSPESKSTSSTIAFSPGVFDAVVEPGRIFVMGDNRENSFDSPDFGTISADDVIGKLKLRIYPFSKFDKF